MMQGYHLFEYATIRLVPKIERAEFVNIGSILYCSEQRFLQSVFHWDDHRILALFPEVDLEVVKQYSHSFELICEGSKAGESISTQIHPVRDHPVGDHPVGDHPVRNHPLRDRTGIAAFEMAERFRWLTATRSTIIQSSPVHTGYTQDAIATLQKMHQDLVKVI
jgi:hypothetical protein